MDWLLPRVPAGMKYTNTCTIPIVRRKTFPIHDKVNLTWFTAHDPYMPTKNFFVIDDIRCRISDLEIPRCHRDPFIRANDCSSSPVVVAQCKIDAPDNLSFTCANVSDE